jgi:hypothetical protein
MSAKFLPTLKDGGSLGNELNFSVFMPKIRTRPEGLSSSKFRELPACCSQACPALRAPGLSRAFFRARQPAKVETTQNSMESKIWKTILQRESLDSSNAITRMHKIWRACPC